MESEKKYPPIEQSPDTEKSIGSLSISEWLEGAITRIDSEDIPKIKSEKDLSKVLAIQRVISSMDNSADNWIKELIILERLLEPTELEAVEQYLLKKWVGKTRELREKSSGLWTIRFSQLIERFSQKYQLPQDWLEASLAASFFHPSNYEERMLIDDLESSSKTVNDVSWQNATSLRQARDETVDITDRLAQLGKKINRRIELVDDRLFFNPLDRNN